MKLFSRLALLTVIFYGASFVPNQDLKAQDPRYTQYYNAPLRLNPAMTGAFDGLWRLGGNYRTQWASVTDKPYTTYNVMADLKTPVLRNDYVGVGFSALTDVSGGGLYNITDIGFSASYHKKLSGGSRRYSRNKMTSYLIAGAQLGLGQRSIKWEKLTYSTQYVTTRDGDMYDPSIFSGEGADRRATKLYPDLSAGLMWFATFGKRKSIYAGLSLYHINAPNISLINRTSKNKYSTEFLQRRIVGHIGGEYLLGKRGSLSLLPGFVAMFQGPSMEINYGLGIKYQGYKYDDFALRFSVWNRLANKLESDILADALMISVGIDYLSFRFGLSYDINISSLSKVSHNRGSLEFSIIYVHDGSTSRGQECPAFN